MRAVTESGGAFVAVSDEEILESIPLLARKAGVFGEPAGVAGAAGVKQAVDFGDHRPQRKRRADHDRQWFERYSKRDARRRVTPLR